MDKYRRVYKEKEEREAIQPNEIRVVAQRGHRPYITYAIGLLTAEGETAQRTVHLRAMGRAINKAIGVAEIIKRRVAGLHQINKLESNQLVDTFEPLIQGLDEKQIFRMVSTITITLSKDQLDVDASGYQAPLDASEVKEGEPIPVFPRGRGARGGRSQGRGRGAPTGSAPAVRGRGGRGRGASAPRGASTGRGAYGPIQGRGGYQSQQTEGAPAPRRGGRGGRRGGGRRGGRGGGRGVATESAPAAPTTA